MPAAFTPLPLEQHPIHAISESSSFGPATLPPAVNTSVQESTEMSDEGSNTSRGRKRKGDEVIANMAKSAKIARSNGVENVHELTGEGGESVNERVGRPTMSGRVPFIRKNPKSLFCIILQNSVNDHNGAPKMHYWCTIRHY